MSRIVSYDVASATHQSLVHGGNGGEFSEYSKAVADDSPPVPGTFDATRLRPALTRDETLPRRVVKHDEANTAGFQESLTLRSFPGGHKWRWPILE